jgi:hypothetical protein
MEGWLSHPLPRSMQDLVLEWCQNLGAEIRVSMGDERTFIYADWSILVVAQGNRLPHTFSAPILS